MGKSVILIGKPKLDQFKQKHADASTGIDAWTREVERTSWSSPHDVQQRYNSADFPGKNQAVFNIQGNKFRILAKIYYDRQTVIVDKVGTHSEYIKWRIK